MVALGSVNLVSDEEHVDNLFEVEQSIEEAAVTLTEVASLEMIGLASVEIVEGTHAAIIVDITAVLLVGVGVRMVLGAGEEMVEVTSIRLRAETVEGTYNELLLGESAV